MSEGQHSDDKENTQSDLSHHKMEASHEDGENETIITENETAVKLEANAEKSKEETTLQDLRNEHLDIVEESEPVESVSNAELKELVKLAETDNAVLADEPNDDLSKDVSKGLDIVEESEPVESVSNTELKELVKLAETDNAVLADEPNDDLSKDVSKGLDLNKFPSPEDRPKSILHMQLPLTEIQEIGQKNDVTCVPEEKALDMSLPVPSSGVELETMHQDQDERYRSAVDVEVARSPEKQPNDNARKIESDLNCQKHEEYSKVLTATVADVTDTNPIDDTQPICLRWTFGINRYIACINLSDQKRTTVVYSAAQTAVMFDYKKNTQKILQGHGNTLTCMDCSTDKRWLVTADKGPGSCVIVWDTYTSVPVQTMFDIQGEGYLSLAMSPDAKYIVTLSACSPQKVCIWNWTINGERPMYEREINPAHGIQTHSRFHCDDNVRFVTNSETQVIFFSWASGELILDAPFLSDSVFNRGVGLFSQSIFQDGHMNRALTATSLGNIVVWTSAFNKGSIKNAFCFRYRPLKLVRVKDKSLTALTQIGELIVTGDVAGHVRFFDRNLNLLNWYQHLNVGPINGISFSCVKDEISTEYKRFPIDATLKGGPFVMQDFAVSSRSAEIAYLQTDGSKVIPVMQEHNGAIHAIAASPTKSWICVGSYAGLLKLWDYENKRVVATRLFTNKTRIQCLTFSDNGMQIAVGMTTGAVHLIDALSLADERVFHYARKAITHCKFSLDSKFFATGDDEFTTTVFVYNLDSGWSYLGRHQAHYDAILDILFGVDLDSNHHRLLTLGKDRILVEYDLLASSKDNLRLLSCDRVEQSAVPLCIAWYPSLTKEDFLVTANDEYKMKLLNTTTKMCRKTLLGPTYGSPIKRMLIAPTFDGTNSSLMLYATEKKVGVHLLPLDGNPHRSVSLIAHPQGVSQITCSMDGRYVFTSGGNDTTVHMWSIVPKAMEAMEALGGSGLTPFYGLIDGGKEGEMFAEMENYFYYAQLQSQDIETTEERLVSTQVDLDQVPFLMRAMGFYPSEQQVEDLINEVKFCKFVDTGEQVNKIDLEDFIKLYINHRPAFGLSSLELDSAFAALAAVNGGNDTRLKRDVLLNELQKKGEHMTENEISEYLATLVGVGEEGGSTGDLTIPKDIDNIRVCLDNVFPETLTSSQFASEVLGIYLHDK